MPNALTERTGAVPPTATTSGDAAGNWGARVPPQFFAPELVPPLSPLAARSVIPLRSASWNEVVNADWNDTSAPSSVPNDIDTTFAPATLSMAVLSASSIDGSVGEYPLVDGPSGA